MNYMADYISVCLDAYRYGRERTDRTGIGTKSIFGPNMAFRNIEENFPLLTRKYVHWKSVAHELVWFIRGETNIRYLKENGVSIWDEWADEKGDLGPVYGRQWRSFGGDQLANAVRTIIKNPDSRRIIVSSWNAFEIDNMALPPCHVIYQFYVDGDFLSLKMYQRSADLFLGVPFNIASYALLLKIIAKMTNKTAKDLFISFGDAHIYLNHMEQMKEMLSRPDNEPPKLVVSDSLNLVTNQIEIELIPDFLDTVSYNDFALSGYNPHPPIKADVAV